MFEELISKSQRASTHFSKNATSQQAIKPIRVLPSQQASSQGHEDMLLAAKCQKTCRSYWSCPSEVASKPTSKPAKTRKPAAKGPTAVGEAFKMKRKNRLLSKTQLCSAQTVFWNTRRMTLMNRMRPMRRIGCHRLRHGTTPPTCAGGQDDGDFTETPSKYLRQTTTHVRTEVG